MALNSGDMTKRITIEQLRAPDGVDPDQYPIDDWIPLVTLYAERIDTVAGDETYEPGGAQVQATTTTRFRFHYRADMDPEQIGIPKRRRVVVGTRIYNVIDARQVEGHRRGIELVTREDLR